MIGRTRRKHTLLRNNVYRVEIEHRLPVEGLWFRPLIRRIDQPGVEWSMRSNAPSTMEITAVLAVKPNSRRAVAMNKIIIPFARVRIYRYGRLACSVRIKRISWEYAVKKFTIYGESHV